LQEQAEVSEKGPVVINMDMGYWAMIIVVGIAITGMMVAGAIQCHEYNICKQNGYEHIGGIDNLEKGYVYCCKDRYVDHINLETCDAVKK
jgi:hypothetical protein